MSHPINITLTLAEILALPGEAAIDLIRRSDPSQILVIQAREMETNGKARWVVMNGLRNLRPTRIGCAKCDRQDGQAGHAAGCPNA